MILFYRKQGLLGKHGLAGVEVRVFRAVSSGEATLCLHSCRLYCTKLEESDSESWGNDITTKKIVKEDTANL